MPSRTTIYSSYLFQFFVNRFDKVSHDDFFRLFHFIRVMLPKFLLNREAVADNTQKGSPYPALPEMPRSAGISGRAG